MTAVLLERQGLSLRQHIIQDQVGEGLGEAIALGECR